MELGLEGKIILITGGARGIGAEIARACAREGAVPVLLDRDADAIAELKANLRGQELPSESILTDLTDVSNSCQAIQDFARQHGCIDGLVNNAGTNDGVGLEYGTPEEFAASLRRNLVHYYTVTQTALPFLKQSQGAIVNISSKVAVTGQGGTSGYAAAKGAILELTTDWAAELASYGIRVNTVVPAEVRTGQYEKWLQKFENPQEKLREISARIPLGKRMTQPSEIADAVVLLLSPRSTITGQQIYVDGGYVHLDRALT
jgi:L-fucose dehydrogenase